MPREKLVLLVHKGIQDQLETESNRLQSLIKCQAVVRLFQQVHGPQMFQQQVQDSIYGQGRSRLTQTARQQLLTLLAVTEVTEQKEKRVIKEVQEEPTLWNHPQESSNDQRTAQWCRTILHCLVIIVMVQQQHEQHINADLRLRKRLTETHTKLSILHPQMKHQSLTAYMVFLQQRMAERFKQQAIKQSVSLVM